MDDRTYAPFHQHFLVARLDLDVDGEGNTVMEVDSEALPISEANPYGLDLVTVATPVRSEAEAARDYSWERQRSWKVVNPPGPTGTAPPRRTSSSPEGRSRR